MRLEPWNFSLQPIFARRAGRWRALREESMPDIPSKHFIHYGYSILKGREFSPGIQPLGFRLRQLSPTLRDKIKHNSPTCSVLYRMGQKMPRALFKQQWVVDPSRGLDIADTERWRCKTKQDAFETRNGPVQGTTFQVVSNSSQQTKLGYTRCS